MPVNILIPQPSDNLSKSQQDLLNNNGAFNIWSLADHYAFNDATANAGFHNKVTQPQIIGNVDPTTTTNPVLYAIKRGTSFPVLQYSRGVSNQVPSPVTTVQSPATPQTILMNGGILLVIDFAALGVSFCMGMLYAKDTAFNNIGLTALFSYDNNNLFVTNISSSGSGNLTVTTSGGQLILKNTSNANNFNNIYWTLQFFRIS